MPVSDATLVRPTSQKHSVAGFVAHLAHMLIGAPVWVWAGLDAIIAFNAVKIAHHISPSFRPEVIGYRIGDMALAHAVLFFLASYMFGLYGRQIFNSTYNLLLHSLGANVVAVSATTLVYTWLRFIPVGRWVVLYTFVLTILSALLARLLVKGFAGRTKVRVLLVGDPEKYRYLADQMTRGYGDLYEAPVLLDMRPFSREEKVARTLDTFSLMHADEVVVEDDTELLFDLLHASAPLVGRGGVLRTLSAFYEDLLHQTPIEFVDCRSLIGPGWGIGRQSTEVLKRAFDVGLSAVGLLLTLPLMIPVALLVKLTSRGPIIYRQTRVGRFGRPFSIYKFRTMHDGAEKDGPVWAARADGRTTAAGRFLRRTRLDELPQLWNILMGQMSFVGPRPERPEFVAELERDIPFYQLRHLVPPGLTGWAQIRYRYGASVEDAKRKLSYDLYYVRRYGLAFDLAICLKTVIAMTRGAR